MNEKVETNLTLGYMEQETVDHFHLLVKVLKWLVFPSSLFYVLTVFWYFGENALDSAFWGLVLFIYSNFLPDLPAVFCRYQNKHQKEALPWYTRYTLILFAPLFVWLVFSDIPILWRPLDTFHNIKALIVYALLLVVIGLVTFGASIETWALPLYGVTGYLVHLKVDNVW
jgi:hypothetical protein